MSICQGNISFCDYFNQYMEYFHKYLILLDNIIYHKNNPHHSINPYHFK